jgi:serine/threonine protein kinase
MNFGSLVGHTLDGKYKIERELGRGGMGAVYLSTHVGTERPVAVKVIVPQFMMRAEFVERFRREARAAGRLRHPNVVDVTDFGFADTSNGRVAYLVMEYLDGCTLGEILAEEGNLPVSWTIDILEQVCSAVQEAHGQGIIHRDLKPDNIWLEPNQRGGYTVKVLDFGIAKLEEPMTEAEKSPAFPGEPFKSFPARATIVDISQEETVAENFSSTAVGEAATAIQINEPKTLISEAGTLSESKTADSEARTAVFQENSEANSANEALGTRLMSAVEIEKNAADNLATDKRENKQTNDLTRVGAVLGTPLYMSPEQCRGERLDARSDIYSLAVIAYQMLSGKLPFEGSFTEVMRAHQETAPPVFETKKVPKRLKRMIIESLSKDKETRPVSAEAFASRLRANSEGLGTLLRRALVIYSEHLPKFLLLSFLTALPVLVISWSKAVLRFLETAGAVEQGFFSEAVSGILSLVGFFVQIFFAAFLVGMTTWIVAQILAMPLRPISLRAAFVEVKKHWKALAGTVTLSTLLAMLGFLFCLIPGVWLSARYMLIAPSIMMEDLSGRAAFRRSTELVKRSFRTVFATAVLVYLVPGALAVIMAVAIGGIVKTFVPGENQATEQTRNAKPEDGFDINFQRGNLKITTADEKNETNSAAVEQKGMMRSIAPAISEGLFELLWSPVVILISSFTSVITALLYFKTRQAGGETMRDLLKKFESAEMPHSKWQERVRQRLLQSGRTTGKS